MIEDKEGMASSASGQKVLQIIINCCLNSVLSSIQKTQQSRLKTTTWRSLSSSQQCGLSCLQYCYLCRHACQVASVVFDSCNPMDRSPPGFFVLGILQARILEWAVMPFSRGSSWPRDPTRISSVSCISRQVLYH